MLRNSQVCKSSSKDFKKEWKSYGQISLKHQGWFISYCPLKYNYSRQIQLVFTFPLPFRSWNHLQYLYIHSNMNMQTQYKVCIHDYWKKLCKIQLVGWSVTRKFNNIRSIIICFLGSINLPKKIFFLYTLSFQILFYWSFSIGARHK